MYKYIDRLLTLFPNEPAYFTPYGLKTDFVGHPVIESSMIKANPDDFLKKYNIPAEKKIALLLPGSRHNEVANLLPVFLETANELKAKHPELYFVLPTVKTVEQRVRKMLAEKGADILVVNTQEDRYAAARAAQMAVAASGTVALELAIVDVPHLIAYKAPKITAWLVRHISNIKFVNLTNILLDKLIVPELLQEDCTKEKLYDTAEDLLNADTALYKREVNGFKELRKALGFGETYPSQKAAEIILQAINGRE